MTALRARKEFELTGKHVLAMFLVFFGLMVVMNAIMVWNAITTFPGEDRDSPYLQGLQYNETLARRADQTARGWTAQMGLEDGEIVLKLQGLSGAPVGGLTGVARLSHLVDDHSDQNVTLQDVGDGTYRSTGLSLRPGAWRVRVSLSDPNAGSEAAILFETVKVLEVR